MYTVFGIRTVIKNKIGLLILIPLFLTLILFSAKAFSEPEAVITTSIFKGDPNIPDSDFTLLVKITSNPTGKIPVTGAFRVNYNPFSADFISVENGDIGEVYHGPETGTLFQSYIDVATTANPSNIISEAECFYIKFHVPSDCWTPYSIIVSDNPNSSLPLLANDWTTNIPHSFDNSATTFIGPDTMPAIVKTIITDGNPSIPDSDFTVLVKVVSNGARTIPVSSGFRVRYNPNSVSFVPPLTDGDLGSASYGIEEKNGFNVVRDIATQSNAGNLNILPDCFSLKFHVNNNPYVPFSINMMDDPKSSLPLLASDFTSNIPHVFDNSWTINLGPKADTAIVKTIIIDGDPSIPDSDIKILVKIVSNGTGMLPVSNAFRVRYNPNSVFFVPPPDDGELGGVSYSDEETDGMNVFRDISTQSNAVNNNLLPDCFILTFHIKSFPATPFIIEMSDDPKSSVPLLANDFVKNIPHIFDNSETSEIGPPPTPTPTPSPTPSPTETPSPTPTETPTPIPTETPSPTPTETPTPTPTPAETEIPTPTPSETPTPTPTETPLPSPTPVIKTEWTFDTDEEGWIFSGQISNLTPPVPGYIVSGGMLTMQANTNINCFGFWQSPGIPIVSDNIYRGSFYITSDQEDPNVVPIIRTRLHSQNNDMSLIHAVESQNGADESPTTQTIKIYESYFVPPESLIEEPAGSNGIIAAFDILNIWDNDASKCTIALDKCVIERTPIAGLPDFSNDKLYLFTEGTDGWSSGTARNVLETGFGVDPDKGIISISSGGLTSFGFWLSPVFDIEANRIYRAIYKIARNDVAANDVPDFRIRAISENFQASTYLLVNSGSLGSSSPKEISEGFTDYTFYFVPPFSASADEKIPGERLAFDLLHINPNDASNAELFIDSIELESAELPIFEVNK